MVDEAQPLPAEGHQPIHRRRLGEERRRPEQKGLLTGPLFLVEPHHHRPARLPKRRNTVPLPTPALAAMSSMVTPSAPRLSTRLRAASNYRSSIAGRVAAFVRQLLCSRHGQPAQPLDTAHHCTLTRSGIKRTTVRFDHARM